MILRGGGKTWRLLELAGIVVGAVLVEAEYINNSVNVIQESLVFQMLVAKNRISLSSTQPILGKFK